ncbi:MAG: hypothetical protein GY953_04750, partial [bacterium]|nr:hypothetical protein [bacterium]
DPTSGSAIEILASLASQPLKAQAKITTALQEAVDRPIDAHSLAYGLEGLAAAFIQVKRHQDALDVLERLLEIVPAHARHHAHLGNAYAGLNKNKEAIAAYELALAGIDKEAKTPEWAEYVTEQLTELRSGAKSDH